MVGRKYAGILGTLAFALVVARNLIAGRLEPDVLWPAMAAMFVMAAVGWLAGTLADTFVSEAVRARFAAAWQEYLAAAEQNEPQPGNNQRRAA